MTKIVVSILIFGLCAQLAITVTVAPTSSSQSSAFSGLNSTATKVYSFSNQTSDSAWDSTAAGAASPTGVPDANVVFGPGATNDTSYVYGIITTIASSGVANTGLGVMASTQSITKIIKRTLNNTIAGNSSDTTESSVIGADSSNTATINANSFKTAVGPGYLGILSQGYDGSYNQVYITLFTGTTPTSTTLTKTADVVAPAVTAGQFCTTTTFGLGNVWYDIGAGAFFYTYYKNVVTQVIAATATGGANTGSCGGSTGATTVNTVYLGGIYANSSGTAYWSPPLSLSTVNSAHTPSNLMGGGDNWLNSSNIYVAYKDSTISTGGANSAMGITYLSKTTKATTTTAGGSFSALVSDTITGTPGTTTLYTITYLPIGIWSSNYTYGIGVSNQTYTQTTAQQSANPATGSYAYTITNYLNSTLTAADSGVTYSSATAASGIWGWQLTTGYTLVAAWGTATSGQTAYTWGSFYGNGTANGTSTTLGTVVGPVSFYEDVNGTQWIGWTDYDTSANSPILTTGGYLAKLQGQLNSASSANVLAALSAVALFFAAILVF